MSFFINRLFTNSGQSVTSFQNARSSQVTVNGKSYSLPNSKSCSVTTKGIICDGKLIVDLQEESKTGEIHVSFAIEGPVERVTTSTGGISVVGDVGSIQNQSGGIEVKGNVTGSDCRSEEQQRKILVSLKHTEVLLLQKLEIGIKVCVSKAFT